jgi:hypothetical protein
MTDTMSGLRPLTTAEVDAVALHMQKVPVGVVAERTGLTAAQIAAAVDQAKNLARYGAARAAAVPDPRPTITIEPEPVDWNAELADTPGKGLVPIDVPVIDRATGLAVELPDEESRRPRPPVTGTDELLARAETSTQPRARQLAADIRRATAELVQVLDSDEKIRVLTASAEVLREHLARTEAELAALLSGVAPTPDRSAAVSASSKPGPDRKAHLAAIRTWANANGHTVAPLGRIPARIESAYHAAHGDPS